MPGFQDINISRGPISSLYEYYSISQVMYTTGSARRVPSYFFDVNWVYKKMGAKFLAPNFRQLPELQWFVTCLSAALTLA